MKWKSARVSASMTILKLCLIAIFAICSGCAPEETLPLTGEISFQFIRMSNSNVYLKLVNQRAETISFRGTQEMGKGAKPWDTLTECKAADSDVWQQGPFALVDGDESSIKILPGEEIEVVIESQLTQSYMGGRCRMSVRLQNGTFIQSNEFDV